MAEQAPSQPRDIMELGEVDLASAVKATAQYPPTTATETLEDLTQAFGVTLYTAHSAMAMATGRDSEEQTAQAL